MAFLNETKEALNQELGSATKANILVGGDELFEVEEALRYTLGRFHMIVGFYGGVARYACFSKERPDPQLFDDRDIEVALALVAPGASWRTVERDASTSDSDDDPSQSNATGSSWVISEYRTTIKDTSGNVVEIIAFHRTIKPYFLAYTPSVLSKKSGRIHDPMQSMDEKLDQLLSDMNTATSPETKIDCIIAVVNELVAERKAQRKSVSP
jgi:hypothetical protein